MLKNIETIFNINSIDDTYIYTKDGKKKMMIEILAAARTDVWEHLIESFPSGVECYVCKEKSSYGMYESYFKAMMEQKDYIGEILSYISRFKDFVSLIDTYKLYLLVICVKVKNPSEEIQFILDRLEVQYRICNPGEYKMLLVRKQK